MIEVDVVMLSLGDSESNRKMTQQAIDSLHNSEQNIQFNVVVVENHKPFNQEGHAYNEINTLVIPQDAVFNYNRFSQYGVDHTKGSEWIVIANNDLIFQSGWMSEIVKQFNLHEKKVRSFSPWNDLTHDARFPSGKSERETYVGYRTSYEFTGWCIVLRRDLFDQVELSTFVKFWYSDNVIVDQIKNLMETHLLCRHSVVTHLESVTIKQFDKNKLFDYTKKQTSNYYKKSNS